MKIIVNEPLIMIGYWKPRKKWKSHDDDHYPDPNDFVDPDFWRSRALFFWQNSVDVLENLDDYTKRYKKYIASYLDTNLECNKYMGYSACRICDKTMGSTERTDGTYIWPDQLSHYVLEHDVYLPIEFLNHISQNSGLECFKEIDTSHWVKMMKDRKKRKVHKMTKKNTSLEKIIKENKILYNVGRSDGRSSVGCYTPPIRPGFYISSGHVTSALQWTEEECEKLVEKKLATRLRMFDQKDNRFNYIRAYIEWLGYEEDYYYQNVDITNRIRAFHNLPPVTKEDLKYG